MKALDIGGGGEMDGSSAGDGGELKNVVISLAWETVQSFGERRGLRVQMSPF